MSLSSSFVSDSSDVQQLKHENQTLREELIQCKADKDFVWSLWKRLQVANPDITQAIGVVLQREKEKNEATEHKLTRQIIEKDDLIDKLRNQVDHQSQEISDLFSRKLESQNEIESLQLELRDTLQRVSSLQQTVSQLEVRNLETASRQAVRELDAQNLELKAELKARMKEVDDVSRLNQEYSMTSESMKKKISNLEDAKNLLQEKQSAIIEENCNLKMMLHSYESEISNQKRDVESKNVELESVRRELSDLWQVNKQTSDHANQKSELFRQIQSLQKDTQTMLKNQEDAFLLEINAYEQRLLEANKFISELQGELDEKEKSSHHRSHDCRDISESMTGERSFEEQEVHSNPNKRVDEQSPKKLSRALSQSSQDSQSIQILQSKLDSAEKKIENLSNLLDAKHNELEVIRSSHARRLEKMRSLESSYKLMKQQLRLYEEDHPGSGNVGTKRVKSKPVARPNPKQLQKEDSDAVWNELTYLQKENKKFREENDQLSNELDSVRISLAESLTARQEVQCRYQQQSERLNEMVEKQRKLEASIGREKTLKEKLTDVETQLDRTSRQLTEVLSELQKVTEERNLIEEENRSLTSDLIDLRWQDSRLKSRIARLQKETIRLQRQLKKIPASHYIKKDKQKQGRVESKGFLKQFSDEQEVWQDVSEIEQDGVPISDCHASSAHTSQTNSSTCASLGQNIVNHARLSEDPIDRSTPTSDPDRNLDRGEYIERNKRRFKPVAALSTFQKEAVKKYVLSIINQHAGGNHQPDSHGDVPVDTRKVPHAPGKGVVLSMTTSRVQSTLKQRVATLQNRVNILKSTKDSLAKTCNQQRMDIESLQEQLTSANQKSTAYKSSVQRLSVELENVRMKKESLESKMAEYSFDASVCTGKPDQEIVNLQNRLKTTSSALTKQLEQTKLLKTENEKMSENVRQLTERNDRLERDLSQKRTLVEDIKLRLSEAQNSAGSDAEIMLEVEMKLKGLMENNARLKKDLGHVRSRLAILNQEKFELVKKFTKEIENKAKQIVELKKKNSEQLKMINSLESSAKSHLHQLASKTEEAIDTAQLRLEDSSSRLKEYAKFVKIFAQSLLRRLHRSREICSNQPQTIAPSSEQLVLDPSLARAQQLACKILNLSQSDMTDIMSVSCHNDSKLDAMEVVKDCTKMDDAKKDAIWAKNCESLLTNKGKYFLFCDLISAQISADIETQNTANFSTSLVNLFMEKVEELCSTFELKSR